MQTRPFRHRTGALAVFIGIFLFLFVLFVVLLAHAAPTRAPSATPAPTAHTMSARGPSVVRVDVPAGVTAVVLDTAAGQVVWLTEPELTAPEAP